MNALGIALVWGAVQVTLLATGAIVLGRIAERRRPEVGAAVAALGLAVCVGLTVLAACPLPAWWTWDQAPPVAVPAPAESAAAVKPGVKATAWETPPESGGSASAGLGVSLAVLGRVAARLAEVRTAPPEPFWNWPEVCAVLYLAGAGIGLLRFAAGLLAVYRLRRRSRRLCDPTVDSLLAALCADMACSRRVEVRETAELSTAATVGWLRPLLLLPVDWRTWSEPDLRAVLAHEIAHIRRADYAVWLLARVSAALHFYHPLVYWLVRRLQLQQELAADALGAACAGGRGTYLKALARLALRQDVRPLVGPARAFLPARGTLSRRIHMLRKETGLSRPASWCGRVFLLGLLGALALGVSTLRGPAQSAGGQPSAAPAKHATGKAAPTPAPQRPAFVFAESRADSSGVFAVRPAVVFSHPAMKKLADDWTKQLQPVLQQVGLDKAIPPLEKIEQITGHVCFIQNPKAPKGSRHQLVATLPLIRTTRDYDWNTFIDACKRSDKLVKLICKKAEEIHYEGKTYYRLTEAPMFGGMPNTCIGLVDRQTLIVSQEEAVKKVFREGLAPVPGWIREAGWDHVQNNTVAIALDNRKGQCKEILDLDDNPPADLITLMDRKGCAVFGADWTGELKLDAYAAVATGQEAKQLAAAASGLFRLGCQDLDKELVKSHKPAVEWRLVWARQLLQQAKVERCPVSPGQPNARVHVHSHATFDAAQWVQFLRDAEPAKTK